MTVYSCGHSRHLKIELCERRSNGPAPYTTCAHIDKKEHRVHFKCTECRGFVSTKDAEGRETRPDKRLATMVQRLEDRGFFKDGELEIRASGMTLLIKTFTGFDTRFQMQKKINAITRNHDKTHGFKSKEAKLSKAQRRKRNQTKKAAEEADLEKAAYAALKEEARAFKEGAGAKKTFSYRTPEHSDDDTSTTDTSTTDTSSDAGSEDLSPYDLEQLDKALMRASTAWEILWGLEFAKCNSVEDYIRQIMAQGLVIVDNGEEFNDDMAKFQVLRGLPGKYDAFEVRPDESLESMVADLLIFELGLLEEEEDGKVPSKHD